MKNYLRKLARSVEWQTRYRIYKELNIPLFKNHNELTAVQILFLNWLATYDVLYQDLYLKEPNISEKVIDKDELCDAYLYWKRNKKEEKVENNDGELSASRVSKRRITFDAKMRN